VIANPINVGALLSQPLKPNLQLVIDSPESKAVDSYHVACRPVQGTSQELAVTSPADVTLYYGNRGGGKTFCMLLNYARDLDKGYGYFYKGLVLGYEFQSLTNIIDMSQKVFGHLPGARFYGAHTNVRWVFRCGEQLLFRHCRDTHDYEKKVHGSSIAWLGIEESTNWESPEVVDKAATTLRTGFKPDVHSYDPKNPAPPLKTRMVLVTNPSGKGRDWHRDRYIIGKPLGVIVDVKQKVPVMTQIGMKEIDQSNTQVALFGSFVENPFYSLSDRAALMRACQEDPVRYQQWIKGSWDVTSGGAIDDIWDNNIHVVPSFVVPSHWIIDRAHDWGSMYPSATIWFAESDGSQVFIDGRAKTYPRGTLFAIEELYTSDKPGYNLGQKKSVAEVCAMIHETEAGLRERGIITSIPKPGPADSSIRISKSIDTPSIKTQMEDCGVFWTDSDKAPGARINGLQLLRQRLKAAKTGEAPALYVCNNCRNTLKLLPPIQRDEKMPEDVDKDSEDHIYDAIRYRVLAADRHIARKIRFAV